MYNQLCKAFDNKEYTCMLFCDISKAFDWVWHTGLIHKVHQYGINGNLLKVVIHVEMPKAVPKKSICHFQKLEMILKWNKQNTVRLPQKYQFVLIKHKINCKLTTN